MKKMSSIFLVFLLLFSCNSFEKSEIKIEAVKELLDCEEENFHMRIIKADGRDSLVGQIILPELIDEIKSKENFATMFPANKYISNKFYLKGYLSKKGHNRLFEGCIGAKVFQVTDFQILTDN
jgi:hypothetical protein